MKRTIVHPFSPTKLLRSILTQRGPQLRKWSPWLSSWRNFQHFLGRQQNSQNLHTDLNFEVHPGTPFHPLPKSEQTQSAQWYWTWEQTKKKVNSSEHCPSCLTFLSHNTAEEFSTKYYRFYCNLPGLLRSRSQDSDPWSTLQLKLFYSPSNLMVCPADNINMN